MPRTDFNHAIDGFAFNNSWTDLSPADLDQLSQEIANLVAAASFSPLLAPFTFLIPPGPPVSNLILRQIVQGLVRDSRQPLFGLCGGMACAALDYWNLRWVPPRGTAANDHPTFATPAGGTLRTYIWSRLIDTLHSDGLTCLMWMAIGFNIFPFNGGWGELLRRTRDEEWLKIKAHLDAGTPWPIGIIGETSDPMSNHQALATGYEDSGDGHPTLYLMDSNNPDAETVLELDFTGSILITTPVQLGAEQGPVRGIYCENYTPKTPPTGVAIESSIHVDPPGPTASGGAARVSYSARNTGFGPSPAMRLFGVGRVAATGSNVDAGFDRNEASSFAPGESRSYAQEVVLTGELGLRRYSVGVSVEQAGRQAWRTLPRLTADVADTSDLVVTNPVGPWATMGGQFVAPPSAGCTADNRILVVGIGLDSRLWRMEQTAPSNGWGQWTPCAAGGPPLTGRAAIANNADGRVEVFARGNDGGIWHTWQNQPDSFTDWSAWTRLGEHFAGEPSVVANRDGRLEVFAVSDAGRLSRIWQWPFGWNGWAEMASGVIGRPGVGRHPDGRLEVFVRRGDGSIFHAWQTSAGGDWASGEFGGIVTSDLTVCSNADGRMEVFARGTDGSMWHRWISAGGWSEWASLGGQFPADVSPSGALNRAGVLELFSRGTDQAVWHTTQNASLNWLPGWLPLGGGAVASDPVAVANADGRLELLTLGLDRTAVHRWQAGAEWN